MPRRVSRYSPAGVSCEASGRPTPCVKTGGIAADGLFSYDTASVWAKGYDAYLAKVGDATAGFAFIGSACGRLADVGAHDVPE